MGWIVVGVLSAFAILFLLYAGYRAIKELVRQMRTDAPDGRWAPLEAASGRKLLGRDRPGPIK